MSHFVDPDADFVVLGQAAADGYRRLTDRPTAKKEAIVTAILAAIPGAEIPGAEFVEWGSTVPGGQAFVLRLALAGCKYTCDVAFVRAYDGDLPQKAPDGVKGVVHVKQLWLTGTSRPALTASPNRKSLGKVRARILAHRENQTEKEVDELNPKAEATRTPESNLGTTHMTADQAIEKAESLRNERETIRQESMVARGQLREVEEQLSALKIKLRDRLPFPVYQSLVAQRDALSAEKKKLEAQLSDFNARIYATMPTNDRSVIYEMVDTLIGEVRDLRRDFGLLREAITRSFWPEKGKD